MLTSNPQPIAKIQVISLAGATKGFKSSRTPFVTIQRRSSLAEGKNKHLELEDADADAFGIFVNWLYTPNIADNEGQLPSCEELMSLWLLADFVLVPRLQNKATEKLEEARRLRGRLGNKSAG